MSADATAGRYQFGIRVDDPRQALDQLADTIPLVDDIAVILQDFMVTIALEPIPYADLYRAQAELKNLSRRLDAIHARLST